MKRRSSDLDTLWQEITYGHELRGAIVPARWVKFYRLVHAIFSWKAAHS
jgi:hypothetical protein